MYWYRSNSGIVWLLFSGLLLTLCCAACKPDIKETGAALKYFDLKGYFNGEIGRLTKLNKPVVKTVTHNGTSESKKVHINNWGTELDLFVGSDINRPAWKDSYTVTCSDNFFIYKAKFPELKMRQMVIKKDKGMVKWILIFNRTKNILYQTTEKLSYFPDSLYLIEKDQKVRLMAKNKYKVQGLIDGDF